MTVALSDFKSAAADSNGQTLKTQFREKSFYVEVDARGIWFTPESTNKPRLNDWKTIERILDRFNQTQSLHPSDYLDLTRNSAYALTIIARLLHSRLT